MNERELATVMAALRYWQKRIENPPGPVTRDAIEARMEMPHHFTDVEPLCSEEIDDLLTKLNYPEPVTISLKDFNDDQLNEEVRRRGYEVSDPHE